MSLPNAVASELKRHGTVHTLRLEAVSAGANAWTKGAAVPSYSECIAHERRFKPSEIRGGINENDALITVDAATCLSVPVAGGRIAPGSFTGDAGAEWRQIVNVYAAKISGRVAVYKLTVRR